MFVKDLFCELEDYAPTGSAKEYLKEKANVGPIDEDLKEDAMDGSENEAMKEYMEVLLWELENCAPSSSAGEDMKKDTMRGPVNEDMKGDAMDGSADKDINDYDMDSRVDEDMEDVAIDGPADEDKPDPQDVVMEVSSPDAISLEEKQQGGAETVSRTNITMEASLAGCGGEGKSHLQKAAIDESESVYSSKGNTLEEDHPPIIINGQQTEENILYRKETHESPLQHCNVNDQLYDSTADRNWSSVTYASDKNKENRDIDGIINQGDNIGDLFDELVNNIFQDNKHTQESVVNLPINEENIENPPEEIINTNDSGPSYNIVMREETKHKINSNSHLVIDDSVSGNNIDIGMEAEGYIELDIFLRNYENQKILENIMQIINTENNEIKEDMADITHNTGNQWRNEANNDEIQINQEIGLKKKSNKRTKHNKNSSVLNAKTNGDTNDPVSSNTICAVCGDKAKGHNYDVLTCEGCKRFFRLSIADNRNYEDECNTNRNCVVNFKTRTDCRLCRLEKCIEMGMKKELVGVVLKQRKEKMANKKKVVKRLTSNLVTPSTTKISTRNNTKGFSAQTDVPRTECMYCGKQGIDKKSIRSHERTKKCRSNLLPEAVHLPPPPPPTQKRNRKRKTTDEPVIVMKVVRPKMSA